MRFIFFTLLSFVFINTSFSQDNYSLDNDKALTVETLANLSIADISSLDNILTSNGYKLTKTDVANDILSYGFMRYNVFLIRRQIKEKLIDIQTRYIDEIWGKYISGLQSLGLTLQKTNILDNGIQYIYANDKWYAVLTKKNTDDVTKPNDMMFTIGPLSK